MSVFICIQLLNDQLCDCEQKIINSNAYAANCIIER